MLNKKSYIKIILDEISLILAIIGTMLLKYDLSWRIHFRKLFVLTYSIIFLIGYLILKLQKKSWKYTSIKDVAELVFLNVLSGIIFFIIIFMFDFNYNKTSLIITIILSVTFQSAIRFIFKFKNEMHILKSKHKGKKTLIYGAGEAGIILTKEFKSNINFPYNIIGFIDDDNSKKGTQMYGLEVLGNRKNLEKIINDNDIETILLSMPSLKNDGIREIVNYIKGVKKVNIKVVPFISELLTDSDVYKKIRDININDLLGRTEIEINNKNIINFIEKKVVFITGGAGSIGAELARQISKYNPELLVMTDVNENNLYFLELELKRNYPNLKIIAEVCSVREKNKLEFLFENYKPNIVFHAAAHKHVPLMENSPDEAIKNNIFGTKNVAECCEQFLVDKMVLISTDKAVNPTNIMGATKRACELIIQNMSNKAKHTKYVAVRFGNVLGSDGSVIPIFKKLIEEGENLTLTHKDITRYFMTIPEAAQLVMEAGYIAKGGEIFILDMGEPIKIYDLAVSMINISNADVGIDIVGLRPGEKLYEELLYDVNSAAKTENKKIFITKVEDTGVDISKYYDKLMDVALHPDKNKIKELLKEVVVSYKEVNYN